MKKIIFLFITGLSMLCHAQESKSPNGIRFEKGLNWEQVKVKAKAENKYVFVDCYTTWCGPCKFMDENIFPLAEVGKYMNEKFINVKVQMDETEKDDEKIKSWYKDARAIKLQYEIEAFPTYLFFAPDGQLVHRATAAMREPSTFIATATIAVNPDLRYGNLLQKYNDGNRDIAVLKHLAIAARDLKNYEMAQKAANEYIDKLENVFTTENISFIGRFTNNLTDKGFDIFLHNPDRVSKLKKDRHDFADIRVMSILLRQDTTVMSLLKPGDRNPDWNAIQKKLAQRYTSRIAGRTIAYCKIYYYEKKKQWPEYIRSVGEYIDRYEAVEPHLDWFNSVAWNVFEHSNDPGELKTALAWSKRSLVISGKEDYMSIDTYANLLYKLGKKDEAIAWEEKAVNLADHDYFRKKMRQTLEKMKKGEKTWSLEQKKPLDHSVYDIWPGSYPGSFAGTKMTGNGKFIVYRYGAIKTGQTTVVQATDNSWKKELPGVNSAYITANDRFVLYKASKDSLAIIALQTHQTQFVPGVHSFKVPAGGRSEWFAYLTRSKDLVLRNLATGKEKTYHQATAFYFNDQGTVLLLQMKVDTLSNSLSWISLADGKEFTIMNGQMKLSNFIFDAEGRKLVFIADENGQRSFRYFTPGLDSAKKLFDTTTGGWSKNYEIGNWGTFRFSKNGHRFFFPALIRDKQSGPAAKSSVGVNVWHYLDEHLQSEQLTNQKVQETFVSVYDFNQDKVIRLQQDGDGDGEASFRMDADWNSDYALVITKENVWEKYWRPSARPSLYLVSVKDGTRKLIQDTVNINLNVVVMSPLGKYIVWYDRKKENYFSYKVFDGTIKNITKQIPVPLYADDYTYAGLSLPAGSIFTPFWTENDEEVTINDNYDIWQVDPDGIQSPVNITQGFGRKNNIQLRILNDRPSLTEPGPVINQQRDILLKALNRVTIDRGFYKMKWGQNANPVLLTMGPYEYYMQDIADNNSNYAVLRMNAAEAPNLFVSKDLRSFMPLSNLQPQKDYNWLTAELMHWKMPDGKDGRGILYKPENFDSTKKYPVIFYFYDRAAEALNSFLFPESSNGTMNIPYFVSNGYLVFRPEMEFTVGKPAEGACNTLVSAARSLAKHAWVDSTRMGIQGHSFGGYEVNCIVTCTNLFAAAATSAGVADIVSNYNQLWYEQSAQAMYEDGQSRIGSSLWVRPDLYIENSPVFRADKVQTPLLIMHNRNDIQVYWSQGIEWFTALRRLGKKAWMLEYDDEGHGIRQTQNKLDFSIRLKQFFDHYLKGAPAPVWMTRGIPAKSKGIDDGLETDTNMKTPPAGFVTAGDIRTTY